MSEELRPFEREIIQNFKTFSFTTASRGGRSSPTKGVWIRGELTFAGEGYIYELWKRWKRFVELARMENAKLPFGTYKAFKNYMWLLKELGLIRKTREEPSSKKGFPRAYYETVEENLDSPLWENPYKGRYPHTFH